jgi:hypothetical protein
MLEGVAEVLVGGEVDVVELDVVELEETPMSNFFAAHTPEFALAPLLELFM